MDSSCVRKSTFLGSFGFREADFVEEDEVVVGDIQEEGLVGEGDTEEGDVVGEVLREELVLGADLLVDLGLVNLGLLDLGEFTLLKMALVSSAVKVNPGTWRSCPGPTPMTCGTTLPGLASLTRSS